MEDFAAASGSEVAVAVVGASGYTGAELIRLLLGHPRARITKVCAARQAGQLLAAVFPSLSGASGSSFVPDEAIEELSSYAGLLIVALNGDRAPFATSELPLKQPVGYKFVVVEPGRSVRDFVYNVARKHDAKRMLNRPIDVAFAPDGTLYLLDMGQMRLRGGSERHKPGTGKLYRLAPLRELPPITQASD